MELLMGYLIDDDVNKEEFPPLHLPCPYFKESNMLRNQTMLLTVVPEIESQERRIFNLIFKEVT